MQRAINNTKLTKNRRRDVGNGEKLVKLRELGRRVDSDHVQSLRCRIAISDGDEFVGRSFGDGGEPGGARYDV